MIKIRTMKRCLKCEHIMFIRIYPEFYGNIASNVYLDKDGILCSTNAFYPDQLDYECSICGWEV